MFSVEPSTNKSSTVQHQTKILKLSRVKCLRCFLPHITKQRHCWIIYTYCVVSGMSLHSTVWTKLLRPLNQALDKTAYYVGYWKLSRYRTISVMNISVHMKRWKDVCIKKRRKRKHPVIFVSVECILKTIYWHIYLSCVMPNNPHENTLVNIVVDRIYFFSKMANSICRSTKSS